jgi:hypothetical protein
MTGFVDQPATGEPCLLVALVGFEPEAGQKLGSLVENCSALGARWRIADQGGCDLWIVDGANASGLGGGLIEVTGPAPLRFRPAEMPHPVAFTEPLHESVCTSHRFDASSMHSLNVLLTQLARWLGPRLVQQALVAHLVANGASFTRSHMVEVRQGRRLLAVMEFGGDTAVAPDATPADLRGADWAWHERGKAFMPPGFRIASTEQVLWHYANRADAGPPLPSRYARLPIHMRRTPALAPREFADRQLQLVRELAYGPRTLQELTQRTGTQNEAVRRDLAALYLIGAITCDPGRSRAAREHRAADALTRTDPSFIGRRPTAVDELTVPGLARL